jgi:hypothetical protein
MRTVRMGETSSPAYFPVVVAQLAILDTNADAVLRRQPVGPDLGHRQAAAVVAAV